MNKKYYIGFDPANETDKQMYTVFDDRNVLIYSSHTPWPGKPWYYKLWKRIKCMFITPKLSSSNLEPAMKIKSFSSIENLGIPKKDSHEG